MKVETVKPVIPPGGIAALDKVALNARGERLLRQAVASCGGSGTWRRRKEAEARDLLALSQIAPRLHVQEIDLRESLRLLAALRVPVPCCPDGNGQLRVAPGALLGITYRQEALFQPRPGYEFVEILAPPGVWHANVATGPAQMLCLGGRLPAGVRLKELVIMSYGALSMQSVQIDQYDAAGIMNCDAAKWWQAHMDKIPLSRAPFLCPDDV